MRIHHFTLLALCVILPLTLMLRSKVLSFRVAEQETAAASRELSEAVRSSAALLSMDGEEPDTRKAVVENMFMSLYSSRGALLDPKLRAEINRQLPVIVVMAGGIPYVSIYGVSETDSLEGEERYWVVGKAADKQETAEFIHDCLLKALGPATGKCAEYRVNLCEELGSTMVRARTSDSVLAVYRDESENLGDGERLVFSVAQYQNSKRGLYEIWEAAEGRTYHRQGCSHAEGNGPIGVCYDRKECARLGAYPCEKCFGEYGGRENV